MINIKKILYPTDFSSYSNQAYFHAVALAEHHGASLTVLFVHTPDTAAEGPRDLGESRRYWQSQLEQIRPLNANRHTVAQILCSRKLGHDLDLLTAQFAGPQQLDRFRLRRIDLEDQVFPVFPLHAAVEESVRVAVQERSHECGVLSLPRASVQQAVEGVVHGAGRVARDGTRPERELALQLGER